MKSFLSLFNFLAITGALLIVDIMAVGATPVPSQDIEARDKELFPFGPGYRHRYHHNLFPFAREEDASNDAASSDVKDEAHDADLFPFGLGGGYGFNPYRHNRYGYGNWFLRETEEDMSADNDAEVADSKLWPFSSSYGYGHRIFDRPGYFYRREDDSTDASAAAPGYHPHHRYGYRHRHHRVHYRPHY